MKKAERMLKLCKVCNNEMYLTPYKFKNQEYCSNKCKYQWNLTQLNEKDKVFKEKIKDIFGDKITITSNYNGVKNKVSFICNICNTVDELRADKMLEGRSCKVCSNYKFTLDVVKEKIKEIHSDEYEILSDNYIDIETPVTIRHKICGKVYEIALVGVLNGNRCLNCYGRRKRTTDEFSELVSKTDDEYEVVGDYIDNHTKILIKHKLCGEIMSIAPYRFVDLDSRCPRCCNKTSKGERKIEKILLENNIHFEMQKKFDDLMYKKNLLFDFYLEDYNLCIEFNGSQHYKPIATFNGDLGFGLQVIRDAIKQAYCEDNNINLLIIPFWEYRKIEEIIINKINELGGIKNGI